MDGTTCISDGGAYATANPLYQEGNYLLERRFRKMHVDKRHRDPAYQVQLLRRKDRREREKSEEESKREKVRR